MAMRSCGACGRKYRGKGTRVTVLEGRVASEARIACPDCVARSTLVLVPEGGRCACNMIATTCEKCASNRLARDQVAVVHDLVRRLEGQLKAHRARRHPDAEDERWEGYVEALESCIAQLRMSK